MKAEQSDPMVLPETGVAPAGHQPPPSFTPLPILGTVGLTFRIFIRAPWKFLGLVVLEFFVVAILAILSAFAKGQSWYPALDIVVNVLTYLFQSALSGAVVFGVFDVASHGGLDFEAALGTGFRRSLWVLAVLVLQAIIVIPAFLLLVVPGIIVILMLCVAMPACVIETLGPIQSLKRSRAITKGHRWRILGLSLVILVLMLLCIIAVAALISAHLEIVAIVIAVVSFAVFIIIALVLPGILFLQLRAMADGTGPLRLPSAWISPPPAWKDGRH